jgi:hypothetical protein
MIKSIVMMRLVILLMIQESWLVPTPKLPTPWMDGNSELRMIGNKDAPGLLIGFL